MRRGWGWTRTMQGSRLGWLTLKQRLREAQAAVTPSPRRSRSVRHYPPLSPDLALEMNPPQDGTPLGIGPLPVGNFSLKELHSAWFAGLGATFPLLPVCFRPLCGCRALSFREAARGPSHAAVPGGPRVPGLAAGHPEEPRDA